MSYVEPKPGRYRRLKDNITVEVLGCTGSSWADTVAVQSKRLSHVRVENFWKKYAPVGHKTAKPGDRVRVRDAEYVVREVDPILGVRTDGGWFKADQVEKVGEQS